MQDNFEPRPLTKCEDCVHRNTIWNNDKCQKCKNRNSMVNFY